MATQFLIGADPEVFIKNAEGKLVSGHDLLPGSKKEPFKVLNGALQPDGLAGEFNVDPTPANDFESFNKKVVSVMNTLKKTLPKGYGLVIEPSAQFDPEYYEGVPEAAKELGCDPDYCAYSDDPMQPNERPQGGHGLRGAGGHIHIGWGSDIPADNAQHIEICRSFIRNMDAWVGIGMTLIDTDKRRREVYGKAGAYRPKSYGVEYRTPSNAWIADKAYRKFIHTLVSACLNDMRAKKPMYERVGGELIRSVINSGDVRQAKLIFDTYLFPYGGVTIPKVGG